MNIKKQIHYDALGKVWANVRNKVWHNVENNALVNVQNIV